MERLLRRASDLGVTVLEETQAVGLEFANGRVSGVRLKTKHNEYPATPRLPSSNGQGASARTSPAIRRREITVGANAGRPWLRLRPTGKCGARAGRVRDLFLSRRLWRLSSVEDGYEQSLFHSVAGRVRACGVAPEVVMRKVVRKTSALQRLLAAARARSEWLAVSLDGFGRRSAVRPLDSLRSATRIIYRSLTVAAC